MAERTAGFRTTRWSLVLAASRESDGEGARAALSELCEAYWYPLYAFLRRRGVGDDEALDLVQGFVARLLAERDLAAQPERGRFRSYLIGALRNFVANDVRAARAEQRGGGRTIVSLDPDDARARYAAEPVDPATPESLFERSWAIAVLDRALQRIGREYAERGRAALFEAVRPALLGEGERTYVAIADELQTSESAIKVAVHRMRARMGEVIRAEIADTVGSAELVDDELAHLFAALG